jgi:ribA/ribD-fused uncharacterized protein
MINNLRGTFLSNFYEATVIYDGIRYRNAESAFQSAKLADRKERLKFQKLTGAEAKALGKTVKLRDDWNDVKLSVMYDVVSAKFANNPDLRDDLIWTGDQEIVEENTWGDTYWGVCRGKGENHLGKILMWIRKDIVNERYI